MTTYARLNGSIVAEVVTSDPATTFHPSLAAQFRQVPDDTHPGWVETDGAFAAPVSAVPSKADLLSYAAQARYLAETGGMTVGGLQIATDRDSQAMVNGAFASAKDDPEFTTTWKGADGSWSTLTADQIVAIGRALRDHVSGCFAAEKAVGLQIQAGAVTTLAEIDAAFTTV